MAPLKFTIPGPPVPCARPRMSRGGHAFMPKRTKDYQAHVRTCATAARRGIFTGRIGVVVVVYRHQLRGDLDNFFKSVADGMQGVLFENDSQIVDVHMSMHLDRLNPRVEVAVYELAAEQVA